MRHDYGMRTLLVEGKRANGTGLAFSTTELAYCSDWYETKAHHSPNMLDDPQMKGNFGSLWLDPLLFASSFSRLCLATVLLPKMKFKSIDTLKSRILNSIRP